MSNGKPAQKQVQFGFPEIWDEVYSQYKEFFEGAKELAQISEQILQAAQPKALEPSEKAVFVLSRITAIGMMELQVLAANGCGQGAMKIARGMFESAVYAEYLRRHLEEAEDYIDFGHVVMWDRYQWIKRNSPEAARTLSPEAVCQLEENFNRVKHRFASKQKDKCRIRGQWYRQNFSQMAENVGRKPGYELPYSIACSIHHASFEGMLSYFEGKGSDVSFGAPPSLEWVPDALIFGHECLLQALDTLNDCLKLGLDEKIKGATERYQQVWTQLAKEREQTRS